MDTLCAPAALISASAVFIAAPNIPTFCMPWPSDAIISPTPPYSLPKAVTAGPIATASAPILTMFCLVPSSNSENHL